MWPFAPSLLTSHAPSEEKTWTVLDAIRLILFYSTIGVQARRGRPMAAHGGLCNFWRQIPIAPADAQEVALGDPRPTITLPQGLFRRSLRFAVSVCSRDTARSSGPRHDRVEIGSVRVLRRRDD